MKYALISEQQLKIIQDALNQSEIWNHCGHTLETRAQAEEILKSLKPSEPVGYKSSQDKSNRDRYFPIKSIFDDVPLFALDKEQT